jgi:hypothetical protein
LFLPENELGAVGRPLDIYIPEPAEVDTDELDLD